MAYEKVELVLKLAIKIENENALDKKSLNQFIYYSFRLLQLSFSVLINKIDEFWSLVERLCYKPLLMWYSNSYDLMAILCRSNAYEKFYPCLVKICHIITESCQTKNEDDYQRFLRKSILDAIIELTRSYDGYILLNEPLYDEFLVNLYPIIELIKELFMDIKNDNHFCLFCYFYSNFFSIDFKSKKLKNSKFHFLFFFSI